MSEIGLWIISTKWWRNPSVGEAIVLMHKAFDVEQDLSSLGFVPWPWSNMIAGMFMSIFEGQLGNA